MSEMSERQQNVKLGSTSWREGDIHFKAKGDFRSEYKVRVAPSPEDLKESYFKDDIEHSVSSMFKDEII